MLIIIWPLTVYINLGGHFFFASHSPVKEYKVIIDCTFKHIKEMFLFIMMCWLYYDVRPSFSPKEIYKSLADVHGSSKINMYT